MNVAANAMRGQLKRNEPMSRHTSWRVGGPADRYYLPADLQDLSRFLGELPADEPVYFVGLGSNLLVRDGGVRGTVVATSGTLTGLERIEPDLVRAEVGVASAKAARFCARHDLVGGEFLAGIPGTIGGALAMNAGAFGGETWDIVAAVETIDAHGQIRTRPPTDFTIAYRSVRGPAGEWFVAAHFCLQAGDGSKAKAEIKRLLAQRGSSQPTQTANAGSVFKNPPGDHAARLIEATGLKGTCEGKACVSEMHANFIVNTGGARAADIEQLIERVRQAVRDAHGVLLEPEVRIVGEAA
jgi:UDP-N-acetylmuramate dehydrogenase